MQVSVIYSKQRNFPPLPIVPPPRKTVGPGAAVPLPYQCPLMRHCVYDPRQAAGAHGSVTKQ